MEALRALIPGALAPTGNPISTSGLGDNTALAVTNFQSCFLDSGTSALAVALIDARARRANVKFPKVIIPGYCCPDLVSAAKFAGLQPVAVDIGREDASYDLHQLAQVMDTDTVAVIAINFLGVAERLEAIREVIGTRDVALVEDNAQWLPASEYTSVADYVVFSFGRGKPLSLLGGGVVFYRATLAELQFEPDEYGQTGYTYRLKLFAYNLMLRPVGYRLVCLLPFLRLGLTVYKPKTKIAFMDSQRLKLLGANLAAYRVRSQGLETSLLNAFVAVDRNPYSALSSNRSGRLLRFPVLCASEQERDRLLAELVGLGASALYGRSIDQVEGVGALVEVPYPLINAKSFASRLLTLPLHRYVEKHYLQSLLRKLQGFFHRPL
ncbi:DegT/DnrJ/EryC1/StrS family aminotransferase [Simiduia curdlanivorans]|uniref:DegT/DnrJ/EryC1/StrS family aminotransferase n=1 Tax=Simiduia curdlanivorans TaxID=1492769 RepID=A0ABV8V900_9GAMM|nr:DegT/DnrJ/EryC1/StrS family aminotransferase [Simiduia curdlanivorans]MDN3638511.1 DegT/DnrJ/EryC1/StrS family aminotransferase [Simiduia curdlanivorans]